MRRKAQEHWFAPSAGFSFLLHWTGFPVVLLVQDETGHAVHPRVVACASNRSNLPRAGFFVVVRSAYRSRLHEREKDAHAMIIRRKISVQAATALLAAFVAVVLLAAMPSPAAALNWSLPATDLSDGPANNASSAQVAVGVDGATTVVWQRSNGSNSIVQASTRPAGSGTFGAAVNLSAAGGNAYDPQVAVAVDGATTVVWYRWNGATNIVQASTRPAGSDTFGDAENLSDPALGNAYEPQVAVGSDGATTVVWYRWNGANQRLFRRVRARRAQSRLVPLWTCPPRGRMLTIRRLRLVVMVPQPLFGTAAAGSRRVHAQREARSLSLTTLWTCPPRGLPIRRLRLVLMAPQPSFGGATMVPTALFRRVRARRDQAPSLTS